MARFAYKAIDSDGREHFSIVEAEDESGALNEIQREGLYATQVRVATKPDELRARWQHEKEHRKREEERKHQRVRQKHARQRLVVRYADGSTKYGMCYALNPRDNGFHLDLVNEDGASMDKTIPVRFSELKAVFYVKSFDGNFDKNRRYQEWAPEGSELVVVFKDGEVIRGYSLHHYDPEEPRFHLIPAHEKTNNISILVEQSAVAGVYTAQQYEAKQAADLEERKKLKAESADLSQEETMGDFYFETRNYPAAGEQYTAALKKSPMSKRLRKKLLLATYNTGVQHIKRHEYRDALNCMETVLRSEPRNPHALKKVSKLRRIIEKEEQGDAVTGEAKDAQANS